MSFCFGVPRFFLTDFLRFLFNINETLGKRKSFGDIPNEFVSKDKFLSGSLDISNGFNDLFSEIGLNIAKQIPKSKNHYSKFLSNPCSEQFVFGSEFYKLT